MKNLIYLLKQLLPTEPNLSKFPVFLLPMELPPKLQPMPEISGKYISIPMPWWLYRGANRN